MQKQELHQLLKSLEKNDWFKPVNIKPTQLLAVAETWLHKTKISRNDSSERYFRTGLECK